MNMHYLIYKITNRLNNKIYVGKHKTENRADDYFGSGVLIERAIGKHGKENFVKEILFELASEEEMNQRESEIVDEDFVARDDTYNIMVGGQGGGKNNWDIGREKLSQLLQTDEFYEMFRKQVSDGLRIFHQTHENTFKGRTHTTESREKMRKAKVGKYDGEKNPMFGMMWITNGESSIRIKKMDTIPIGYKKGRLVKKSS